VLEGIRERDGRLWAESPGLRVCERERGVLGKDWSAGLLPKRFPLRETGQKPSVSIRCTGCWSPRRT